MRNDEGEVADDLIEIQDPEIDPEQIMARIRERIERRREELGYPRREFPTFGAAAYPGEPEGEAFDPDLYHHLRRANALYHELDVRDALGPSPATRIPVLGRLWGRVRREAHNLVLFYLGKLAQRQVAVNRHVVSTLNRMAVQMEEQRRRLSALEEEIERLRGGDDRPAA